MDSRYWKEFENMGDMEADKRSESGSEKMSPRYRKDRSDRRRKTKSHSHSRSRTRSHSRSRSRSSSSSSSSSSHSSSSSSRRHSDYRSGGSTSKTKRDSSYLRKSPPRVGSNYNNKRDEDRSGSGWFPPSHPNYSSQGQEMPSSASYIPPPYPSSVQGSSYPANFQGQQNFGNNYHGYPGYEPAGNYYPQNFPSQPPPHDYQLGGPSSHPPPANWEMFPDTTQPPPLIAGPLSGDSHQGLPDIKAEEAKKEAIEQELLQQKRTLAKQREDYVKRKFSLNRELNRLKDQKRDLLKENSKDNERILKENAKLQVKLKIHPTHSKKKEKKKAICQPLGEIQQKLKSIDNVIEMLSNIIGDSDHLPEVIKEIKSSEKTEKKKSDKKKREKSEEHPKSSQSSPEEIVREHSRETKERSREAKDHSRDRSREAKDHQREVRDQPKEVQEPQPLQKEENRIYYDPGLHWCPECTGVFPKTISEYLEHLHSAEHRQNTKLKFEDYPWHEGQNLEEKGPQFSKGYPPKRIPIRGVQFLVPATAWFCSMCKVWLGDLHCATKHVQSFQHSNNYSEFIMKNQHWEVDWLTERTRSYERNSEAKQQLPGHSPQAPPPPPPTPMTIASLSDQLLAMIAANSKLQEPPPPPPPPPITISSSSGEESPGSKKIRKKKRKVKKSKKGKEEKSPPKETDQIKLNYNKTISERKTEQSPADESFIAEWMPKVEKRETVQIKAKPKVEINEVKPQKRLRRTSGGSSESTGITADRIMSPYDQPYNDHDEAVVFDKKQQSSFEKSKKKDDDTRHDKHSKYDRSPKDKPKYEERYSKYSKFEKYKFEKDSKYDDREPKYDDHKNKKENKSYSNDKEKKRKSPFSKIKEIKERETERKKGKGKSSTADKNDDDDDDIHETSFEKRTSESAAKKKDSKKIIPNNLPKTKLPFIGRMPILKKKVEQKAEDKEEKKDIEDSASKDSIPEPVIVQEPTVEPPPSDISQQPVEELPKSTLIISKRPRLAEPGIVKKEILFNKPANDNLTEQDMDLDDDNGSLVPKEEEPAKDELHKDFKDALDLLFPEEKKSTDNEDTEVKQEADEHMQQMDEQQAIVASAAPTSYMIPTSYDMSMYQSYYDHAYVQQQWAQMGYDQTGQYASAYTYPPPTMEGMQQPSSIEVIPTTEAPVPTVPEPKKKKNPLSQRMRRHLQKKRAKEAAGIVKEGEAALENGDEGEVAEEEDERSEIDEQDGEMEQEGDNSMVVQQEHKPESKLGDMSDLAMLGIDEDDAAAQGFY